MKRCIMPESSKLSVAKLVNSPAIDCVSRLLSRDGLISREHMDVRSDDFGAFRQNPFVSDTSEVPEISLPLAHV